MAVVGVTLIGLMLPGPALGVAPIHEHPEGMTDVDARAGRVLPTSSQRSMAASMGARITWNRFGTPQSMINDNGWLATGLSGTDAASVARAWVKSNRTLFRLSSVTSTNLVTLNSSRLVDSNGYAVLFRQRFGSLDAANDGLITVGISGTRSAGWKIAYVSSSSAGTQAAPAPATLTATAAWLKAAANVGRAVPAGMVSGVRQQGGWTLMTVPGFSHPQRARLVAVPIPGKGVRAAYETIVLDNTNARALAYTVFVDARSGAVLVRTNRSQQLADEATHGAQVAPSAPRSGNFSGNTGQSSAPATDSPSCGAFHDFEVDDANQSVDLAAAAPSPTNDMVLKLFQKTAPATYVELASFDSGTNPEAGHYPIGAQPFPAGTYAAQVCRYSAGEPHFDYTGVYSVNDAGGTPTVPYPPKWKFFRGNPPLVRSNHADTRVVGCWRKAIEGEAVSGCTVSYPELYSIASRAPWDHEVQTNFPTFTTKGNNAVTGQAWYSPLTPAENLRPASMQRSYSFPWTDYWNTSRCGGPVTPATPNRADVDAAVTNLFAFHNRMHDFSYQLGFTEQNYNMQQNNFGEGQPGPYPGGREADPEVGNAQAGAGLPVFILDAELTSVTNRNNANQITLNDGIPGITNQYLFEPIAGLNYPPCADGDFDGSVVGHEYTHAISNRMIGGPDSGIDGHQGGAMGESWSDQVGIEYLVSSGHISPDTPNAWVVGPYVTGNNVNGIRNFAINTSPLNYSDVGYDSAGPVVHPDGEIWNATGYDIRQALIAKYNARYPATDAALQRTCAEGKRPAQFCPGNRRWIQIMFDAFLLMPSSVSFLDARDAYLAADRMRFNGANQTELWTAFARRGMGVNASSNTSDDTEPKAGYMVPASIRSAANHSTVRFVVRNENGTAITTAQIFVGRFAARVTPVADTRPADTNDDTPEFSDRARFVPGTYRFLAQAPGYGVLRSGPITLTATDRTVTFNMTTNWASTTSGGQATAASEGVNKPHLIDDTEATNWGILDKTTGIDGSHITIDLGGGAHLVNRVQVSALHHPADSEDDNDTVQSRFINLRSFRILACNGTAAHCAADANFTQISSDTTSGGLTGTVNAFPGPRPRPAVPHLDLRSFNVRPTMATHIRLVALKNQCTGNVDYQDEAQDADPQNDVDCRDAPTINSTNFNVPEGDTNLRVAELQVFGGTGSVTAPPGEQPRDPVVVLTLTGPASATSGSTGQYTLTYRNLGPATASNAKLEVLLPATLGYVSGSASNNGTYSSGARTVTWSLGDVVAGATGTRTFKGRIGSTVPVGTAILTQAQFSAPLTYSNPAAWVTVVSP